MEKKTGNGGTRVPRVLLIYREMIPSVRLCGHSQMEVLAEEGKVEYRAVPGLRISREDMEWAEAVILGRLDSWYELQLVKKLKKAGKYLLYILDDDLLNIPESASSASYYRQESIRGSIREMLEMSDAILSPSPLLLEKYAGGGKKAVQVEEPAIDPIPYIPHRPGDPVKIGFAGSIDRIGDLEEILQGALTAVKGKYGKKVAFEFFGAVPSFARELDAKCIPYTESYDSYRKTLNEAHWDIGLAPMPDTPFHACKHYNKFVEYAAAGIAGIYSNVAPYDRLRVFPDCTVLCRNDADEWVREISRLVEEEKLRERMRKAASETAAEKLNVRRCAEPILSVLEKCVGADGGRVGSLLGIKAVSLFRRFSTSLRGHGMLGLLMRIPKKLFFRGK